MFSKRTLIFSTVLSSIAFSAAAQSSFDPYAGAEQSSPSLSRQAPTSTGYLPASPYAQRRAAQAGQRLHSRSRLPSTAPLYGNDINYQDQAAPIYQDDMRTMASQPGTSATMRANAPEFIDPVPEADLAPVRPLYPTRRVAPGQPVQQHQMAAPSDMSPAPVAAAPQAPQWEAQPQPTVADNVPTDVALPMPQLPNVYYTGTQPEPSSFADIPVEPTPVPATSAQAPDDPAFAAPSQPSVAPIPPAASPTEYVREANPEASDAPARRPVLNKDIIEIEREPVPASSELTQPRFDTPAAPVAAAPADVAPPMIDTGQALAAPKLSDESKKILASLPHDIDSPEASADSGDVAISRVDPDIEQLLKQSAAADNVQSHEATGVKIEVRRPNYNPNYELEKAYEALLAGQTGIALELYKNVIRMQPDNELALFGAATTFHRIGEIESARVLYGRLIELYPNNREAMNNFLVLVSDESPQEALNELLELEHASPDFSPIPAQLGLLYAKLGDEEKARSKMLRAISLDPDNMVYRYNLAIFLDKQKRYKEAAAFYRQLIAASQQGEPIPADAFALQSRLNYINSL